MVKFVLKDAIVMYDGRDISGDLHTVGLNYTCDVQDSTVMGLGSRTRLPGLLDVSASHQGWYEHVTEATDSLDSELFAKMAAASGLMSMSPDGGQAGETGFSFTPQGSNYSPGASVGEIFAFSLECMGDGPLVKGTVMEKIALTVTVDGTSRQLGAVGAAQKVYSTIHVTAVTGAGPTLDVIVESDSQADFLGTPETQLTHPQMAVVGANQQESAIGVIADDWWRYGFTLDGASTFSLFGIIAIVTPTP